MRLVRSQNGMTFLELVLVVVMLTLLVALAVPGYRDAALRTHRVDAVNQLLELASCQERTYLLLSRYGENRCGLMAGCVQSVGGHYRICLATGPGGLPGQASVAQRYVLSAEPLGSQVEDRCGVMTLSHIGIRHAMGGAATPAQATACWRGRPAPSR